jgi:phage terminase large subunit-like protein
VTVTIGVSAGRDRRDRGERARGEWTGYVLADLSVAGLSPEGGVRKVAAAAAEAWGADGMVAEKNNGGDEQAHAIPPARLRIAVGNPHLVMVGTVLRGADVGLPVTLVHAADGKSARAEPVAVLFESGKRSWPGACRNWRRNWRG